MRNACQGLLLACFFTCAQAGIGAALGPSNTLSVANTTQAEVCEGVRHHQGAQDACQHVRLYCKADSRVNYMVLYYCHARLGGYALAAASLLGALLWLLLLFRVLASTADSFFSPILGQLSQEIGLPPRLAGVTFLALGNGAPDVSSSVAAIRAGEYKMALGSLFGGGMFVSGVVGGFIVLTGGGVRVRGALMRDVGAYLVATVCVAIVMASGQMTVWKAVLLLGLYIAYVIVVLAADVAHRWGGRHLEAVVPDEETALLEQPEVGEPPLAVLTMLRDPADCLSGDFEGNRTGQQALQAGLEAAAESPKHGAVPPHKTMMSTRQLRQHALAQLAKSDTFRRLDERRLQHVNSLALDDLDAEGHHIDVTPDGDYEPPAVVSEGEEKQQQAADKQPAHHLPPDVEAQLDRQQAGHPQSGVQAPQHPASDQAALKTIRQTSGSSSVSSLDVHQAPPEVRQRRLLRRAGKMSASAGPCLAGASAAWEGVAGVADAVLWLLEWPLVVARRASIPMVEAESYQRGWFVASCALSPVAIALYFELQWPALSVAAAIGVCCAGAAAVVLRHTTEAPEWASNCGFPIGAALAAVAGFFTAVLWIDTVAGELVALLQFLGIWAGIDAAVLGLTVLAWGNSLGDLATNVAMAKNGLANMAMTACFAGPVFSLLISVAVGFLNMPVKTKQLHVQVELTPTMAVAAAFIVLNCTVIVLVGLLNHQRLPEWHGYSMLGFYAAFLVCSLILAFA